MKRIISAIMTMIILCLSLVGCGQKSTLDVLSGEIVESENGYIISFTVQNNTGDNIENLSADIVTYSDKTNILQEKEVEYPLSVSDGGKATLSFNSDKKCVSAKIVSYSYKTEDEKLNQGEFEENNIAYIVKNSTSTIKTREQLAEEMIRDIKTQSLKSGKLSTGSYNSEKKQLVIVSKYGYSYDTCVVMYEKDPDSWKTLEDGIVQMSGTCYDEFQDNGFDDVNVNVGIISSDEELMFSATNGSLVESLGSQ